MLIYLTGLVLLFVALAIFVIAPRNLWNGVIAMIGFVILFIAFTHRLQLPGPLWVAFAKVIENIVSYLAPTLMLLFGLFMVAQAWTLYHREQSKLQLAVGNCLGVLLISVCILHYAFLFGPAPYAYKVWLKIPDLMMTYYVILFANYLLQTARFTFIEDERPVDYVAVLGLTLQREGELPAALERRLDQALNYLKRQQYLHSHTPKVIVSGAKTNPNVDASEAEVMAAYLVARGLNEEAIILEEKAVNTHENFYYSRLYLESLHPDPTVLNLAFITNSYHLYRSQLYANIEGLYHIRAIAAPSTPKEWLIDSVREYVAILFMHRKLHLLVSVGLLGAGLIHFLSII